MEQLLNFLNSIHPMSDGLIEHLSKIIKTRELKKKDYLLKAGHICRAICFIETGLLRCFYKKNDKEVCSWFMKEGDVVISIQSFFDQTESYESIQALEDCTLHYIEYAELQNIYRLYLEFNVTRAVLTEKYYKLWDQQLFGLRMQQAPERYQWLLENHPELILRVSSKHLASWLDISEVMLSRIKGRKNGKRKKGKK